MLKKGVRRTRELVHAADWLPTIVFGAAGGSPGLLASSNHALDGVNQWAMLTHPGVTSARTDLL
jgi:hypothetical protein